MGSVRLHAVDDTYDFDEKLAASKGKNEGDIMQTIRQLLDGCVDVRPGSPAQDRRGIDYIATLPHGSEVFIDKKTREPNCSRYWRGGPEVALETWSVKPEPGKGGVVGWTLDASKKTDYVLFLWDQADSDEAYLMPALSLRHTFIKNREAWERLYRVATQTSRSRGGGSWQSECVFVPIRVVLDAMQETMSFKPATVGNVTPIRPAKPVQLKMWEG